MTNLVHIGDQTVTTNGDGTVTITTLTDMGTTWGIWPTPLGWSIIVLLVVAIAVALFKKRRKSI